MDLSEELSTQQKSAKDGYRLFQKLKGKGDGSKLIIFLDNVFFTAGVEFLDAYLKKESLRGKAVLLFQYEYMLSFAKECVPFDGLKATCPERGGMLFSP